MNPNGNEMEGNGEKGLLFVADASVIFHMLANKLGQYALPKDEEEAYLIASFLWIQQLGFSPYYRNSGTPLIWALDSAPYWRKEIFPEYKAHRPRHSGAVDRAKSVFHSLDLPSLGVKAYEADDIASLLVRMKLGQELVHIRRVKLLTTDSDWQGLCGPDVHFWECAGREPVIRHPEAIYDWLQGKHEKQTKKAKKLWSLPEGDRFRCNDIWQWKSAVGDRGDNLPQGSDIQLIDLFHPPRDFDLWRCRESRQMAIQVLEKSLEFSCQMPPSELRNSIVQLGMDVPLRYIEGS